MNFILAVDKRLGIARDGALPWHIKQDMVYFKKMTYGHTVIMGYNTWEALNKKPLVGRTNVVISTSTEEPQYNSDHIVCSLGMAYGIIDMNIKEGKPVFVIGGDKTFYSFLDRINTIYITHIDKDFKCDTFATFFEKLPYEFALTDWSKEFYSEEEKCSFRFLTFQKTDGKHGELQYLGLLKDIMTNGKPRGDRTGTGTIGVFARQLRFDISKYCPLLTTKFVGYKSIVKELLWFLRGDTNSKTLEKDNVNIWKGNSSREFLDKCKLSYQEGDIGPMYGFNWRHCDADYKGCSHDYTSQGIDQLEEVMQLLRDDPFSRRIMMTTYNVRDRHKGVLYPCHGIVVQFYVDVEDDTKYLSCHMYQRSVDTFLGLAYNIASYSILVNIIALKVGMKPRELVISTGDTHIYNNHIEQCRTQMKRRPYPFPVLEIDPQVKDKDWKDIDVNDFKMVGYLHHPAIKGEMSV